MYIYIYIYMTTGLLSSRVSGRRHKIQLTATNQTTKTVFATCSENWSGKSHNGDQSEDTAISRQTWATPRSKPHRTWVGLWGRAQGTAPTRKPLLSCHRHVSKITCFVAYTSVRLK